jgi:hypothetical protein
MSALRRLARGPAPEVRPMTRPDRRDIVAGRELAVPDSRR